MPFSLVSTLPQITVMLYPVVSVPVVFDTGSGVNLMSLLLLRWLQFVAPSAIVRVYDCNDDIFPFVPIHVCGVIKKTTSPIHHTSPAASLKSLCSILATSSPHGRRFFPIAAHFWYRTKCVCQCVPRNRHHSCFVFVVQPCYPACLYSEQIGTF